MKYKVGDVVHVRKDLILDKKYGCDTFTTSMSKFLGTDQIIKAVFPKDYTMEDDDTNWYFTDEMLEKSKMYTEEAVIIMIGNYLLYHEQKCILATMDDSSTFPMSVREWFNENKKL